MALNNKLPFLVGDQGEAKSSLDGFRGAWFRCKIKGQRHQGGQVEYYLEYFDYPDEEVTWAKPYQKRKLMMRPSFPPCYRENQLPDSYPTSDVVVIYSETWKVGDLVDWWCEGCYWSGRITHLVGKDKIKIKLPEPPDGEGGNPYTVACVDLRPSLDWSPENGWTVPLSRDNDNCRHCARLIRTHRQDEEIVHTQPKSTPGREISNTCVDIKMGSPVEDKPDSFFESSDSNQEKDVPGLLEKLPSGKYHPRVDSPQERQIQRPATMEEAVVKLEEAVNKIKWMKGILSNGLHYSNAMKESWRILENTGTSSKMDGGEKKPD